MIEERGNFTHEDNIIISCLQIMYLPSNYVFFSIFWPRLYVRGLGYDTLLGFVLGFLSCVMIIHLFTSFFSHCAFIWACVTGNLKKNNVRIICTIPFISMCIITILLFIAPIIVLTMPAAPPIR